MLSFFFWERESSNFFVLKWIRNTVHFYSRFFWLRIYVSKQLGNVIYYYNIYGKRLLSSVKYTYSITIKFLYPPLPTHFNLIYPYLVSHSRHSIVDPCSTKLNLKFFFLDAVRVTAPTIEIAASPMLKYASACIPAHSRARAQSTKTLLNYIPPVIHTQIWNDRPWVIRCSIYTIKVNNLKNWKNFILNYKRACKGSVYVCMRIFYAVDQRLKRKNVHTGFVYRYTELCAS